MSAILPATKSWFPNIIIKLVRSNLPPHQQTFHCPPSLTKPDLKQLIEKMYSVSITDIRTMNYLQRKGRMVQHRKVGGRAAFKKVIVTTKSDFIFPEPPNVLDGAVRVPPQVGKGKNSANKVRAKIMKQAIERDPERSWEEKA